ncbi:divalent cation tolerance protein CutA [Limnohabitans sp.]|uniref:divalent cation tolerance protein CutA n=1 Tax=Limnohabitans sp. TaxID=1907725 RepID=UPI0035B4C0B5
MSFRRDENWILAIDRYPQVEQRLRELHPYELPAIYSLRPEQALPAFASWVQQP